MDRTVVNNYKLIFAGPVGSGKTTAIATLSDIPPVTTDELATDMTAQRKPMTTVAMDYGLLKLSESERVHLYGTPGQERFNFMWDILSEGGLGLILLLDNTRHDTFGDMNFFIDAFWEFIKPNRLAIGVTHSDVAPAPTVDEYHGHLKRRINPAIFEVDARNHTDMSKLIEALLCTCELTLTSP